MSSTEPGATKLDPARSGGGAGPGLPRIAPMWLGAGGGEGVFFFFGAPPPGAGFFPLRQTAPTRRLPQLEESEDPETIVMARTLARMEARRAVFSQQQLASTTKFAPQPITRNRCFTGPLEPHQRLVCDRQKIAAIRNSAGPCASSYRLLISDLDLQCPQLLLWPSA